ncbi:MAG: hypothetical protein ACJ0G4_00610 [Alphaproteobacteria bacterium]
MTIENEVELRVCKKCDAPLPYHPDDLSYYNFNSSICDDCYTKKYEN